MHSDKIHGKAYVCPTVEEISLASDGLLMVASRMEGEIEVLTDGGDFFDDNEAAKDLDSKYWKTYFPLEEEDFWE